MEMGLGGLGVGGRADAYTQDAHKPSSRSQSPASSVEAMVWMACSRRKRKRANSGWVRTAYDGVHGSSCMVHVHTSTTISRQINSRDVTIADRANRPSIVGRRAERTTDDGDGRCMADRISDIG